MASKTNHYNVRERKVVVRPDATLYCRFHEEAHREQHELNLIKFISWRLVWHLPFIGWLATLWIEIDADRRARRVMQKLGLWTPAAEAESRNNLGSYFKRKELTSWQLLTRRS